MPTLRVPPFAVFGGDRAGYYQNLAAADALDDAGLLRWCEYVLSGLRHDMETMLKMAPGSTLRDLYTEAADSVQRAGQIAPEEAAVLTRGTDGATFRSRDVQYILGSDAPTRSRRLNGMRDRLLVRPETPNGRIYRIRLAPNVVTPFLIGALGRRGFLPEVLRDQ